MLNLECPSCKAPYAIDEKRLPAQGLRVRCPKCGNSFLATKDGADAKKPTEVPDLPSVMPPPSIQRPRIQPAAPAAAPKGFGELELDLGLDDLPSPATDLPQAKPKRPAIRPVDADLPSVSAGLPASAVVPLPATAGTALPAVARAGLPARGAPPPSPRKPAAPPPMPAAPPAMPPSTARGPQATEIGLGDFGDIDLPSATASAAPARIDTLVDGAFDFGEVSLPSYPPPAEADAEPGGALFGSGGFLDSEPGGALFDATSDDTEISQVSQVDAGPGEFGEAAEFVPEEAAIPEAEPSPAQERPKKGSSKRRRAPALVGVALAAIVVVGGGALQLTPHGAFGYLAISDRIRANEYTRAFAEESTRARTSLRLDTVTDARTAAIGLVRGVDARPRATSLKVYATTVLFYEQARFGLDPERTTKAQTWLNELSKRPNTPGVTLAQAAQHAAQAEWTHARGLLVRAEREPGAQAFEEEIALLRGETEYQAGDYLAALELFRNASEKTHSAAAEFGVARSQFGLSDLAAAKAAALKTLAASPNHPGALIVLGRVLWEVDGNETEALSSAAAVETGASSGKAGAAERAEAAALRGAIALKKNRSGEARAAFQSALELDKRCVSALLGQGDILFREGRYTEALARFESAKEVRAQHEGAIVATAKTKLALERLQDAKADLVLAVGEDPKRMAYRYWLGRAEEALGNREGAEGQYKLAVSLIHPSDPDAVLPFVALSTLYTVTDRSEQARALLDEARTKLPASGTLDRAMGDLHAAEGRFEEALQSFKRAIERDNGDVLAHFRLGVTYRRMRRMAEAATELDAVMAQDKDFPGLAFERGLLYEQSGEVQKALDQFQAALAKAPKDVDLQLRVGAAYVAIGRHDDALPILKGVIEARPTSAEAHHYLGRALVAKTSGDPDAMRHLKRAVELDANRAEYHLYVGWAAGDAVPPDLGLARTEIDKALALDKLLPEAYWQRAALDRKLGAVQSAVADIKHALELKPTLIGATATLAECYEDKNDFGAASATWAKVVAANNRVPYWRYKYGTLLLERGNAREAAGHLAYAADEARKSEPQPLWYLRAEFEAAEAMRKTGQRADAADRYRRFLAVAPVSSPDRSDATKWLKEWGGGSE